MVQGVCSGTRGVDEHCVPSTAIAASANGAARSWQLRSWKSMAPGHAGTAIPNVFAVPTTGADREDSGNAKRKTRLERKQDLRNARRFLLQKVGLFAPEDEAVIMPAAARRKHACLKLTVSLPRARPRLCATIAAGRSAAAGRPEHSYQDVRTPILWRRGHVMLCRIYTLLNPAHLGPVGAIF